MRYQFQALGRKQHERVASWPAEQPWTPPPEAAPALDRILLPLDLEQCPAEAFNLVNRIAERAQATVVLLHVVHLNIPVPENRVFDELGREARSRLTSLASKYLDPGTRMVLRVRTGQPAEQILAAAKDEGAGLLVLMGSRPRIWSRLASFCRLKTRPFLSGLARRLIREAPCSVIVLPVEQPLAAPRRNDAGRWSAGESNPALIQACCPAAME